jgi:hypothetical protein
VDLVVRAPTAVLGAGARGSGSRRRRARRTSPKRDSGRLRSFGQRARRTRPHSAGASTVDDHDEKGIRHFEEADADGARSEVQPAESSLVDFER